MNCPKCGSVLPPNAYFCPVCNEPAAQPYGYVQPDAQQPGQYPPAGAYGGYPPQGYAQPVQPQPPQPAQPQGYPPQGAYQPGYTAPYEQQPTGYPTGYQAPYVYGQQPPQPGNRVLAALSDLPHAFLECFQRPAEVLRRQMEGRDRITGLMVTALVLLMSFLFGMVLARSAIGLVMSGISSLTGVSMASDSASMNQGISYLAGRIAPSAGGVAVLCQLLGMLAPAAVMMTYLCAVCKARFSLELLLGFVTVTTLPTVAVSLAMILLSLLSPWLALVAMLCGMAVSYMQMGALLSFITGKTADELFVPKLICFCASILLSALLVGLIGGAMLGGLAERMMSLLASVGTLI